MKTSNTTVALLSLQTRGMRRDRARRTLQLIAMAACSSFFTLAGAAPTFTVNSLVDVAPVAGVDLTNGVCETGPGNGQPSNGVCTLRAAVLKANGYPGGGVTINIPSGTYALAPNNFTLFVTQSVTIAGAGIDSTIIDGAAAYRVFSFKAVSTGVVSNLTIQNGHNVDEAGGGIEHVGGNLTLDHVHLTKNTGAGGGGLHNFSGTVSITSSRIDFNKAVRGTSTAFVAGDGGGILNEDATLLVNQSVVSDNQGTDRGGGIAHVTSSTSFPMTINDSIVSANDCAEAGGIAVGGGKPTQATVNRTTINANTASYGGGISVGSSATVTINNSTISANSAVFDGGGVLSAGTASLFHVTLAGNIANSSGATTATGGGIDNGNGTFSVYNSLFADNYVAALPKDCSGSVTSKDYNYGKACVFSGTVANNITGGDPLLGPLKNNGGLTPTQALYVGSIAADHIPAATACRDSFGMAPTTDQRSVQRPINVLCDIGAFEGTVPLPSFNANLIRNGDGEDGAGSPNGARVGLPHWTVSSGTVTAVRYGASGGFPAIGTDPVPATHGYNFFAGGSAVQSIVTQTISTVGASTQIDAGTVAFTMSGDFGGFVADNDSAQMIVRFLNGNGTQIAVPLSIGNYNAAFRNNKTGLFTASANGSVPVGTRSIEVSLSMQGGSGAYNDGYADNLSLVLVPLTLDIDGNGSYDALTDGLLVLRYLFGQVGQPLVLNAVGNGATRSQPADIQQYLTSLGALLDIDKNAHLDPLTDGMLVLRYLFGISGPALIAGAVGPNAQRGTEPAISLYIKTLTP